MASLAELAALCRQLADTPGRLDKRRLVAEYLRSLPAGDVALAVAYLTGRPFPLSDPRVLNVRGLPRTPEGAVAPTLELADVAVAFAGVADAAGSGSRRLRDERLGALA